MLADIGEQARLGDGLGYDSVSFTEHHFHIEGFEVSENPVLLDLFVAMQTKRIRVGQLGIVRSVETDSEAPPSAVSALRLVGSTTGSSRRRR